MKSRSWKSSISDRNEYKTILNNQQKIIKIKYFGWVKKIKKYLQGLFLEQNVFLLKRNICVYIRQIFRVLFLSDRSNPFLECQSSLFNGLTGESSSSHLQVIRRNHWKLLELLLLRESPGAGWREAWGTEGVWGVVLSEGVFSRCKLSAWGVSGVADFWLTGSSGVFGSVEPGPLASSPLGWYCWRRMCHARLHTADTVLNWWMTLRGMK